MGLEPGTTKAQVRKCLENWNKGDNGILDLSRAYRLKPGTGWLIDPCILHAPGSLCTYEPQWGSDVFGMYQNLVEGREVPWELLVKDMPKEQHKDLDFIVDQLDWDKNVDPNFKDNHYLEPVPVADTRKRRLRRSLDRLWQNRRRTALHREGTHRRSRREGNRQGQRRLWPHLRAGHGKNQRQSPEQPEVIRFHELTEDEYFFTEDGAKQGVTFENMQRHRAARRPALLRPGSEPRRAQDGRVSEADLLDVTLHGSGTYTTLTIVFYWQ